MDGECLVGQSRKGEPAVGDDPKRSHRWRPRLHLAARLAILGASFLAAVGLLMVLDRILGSPPTLGWIRQAEPGETLGRERPRDNGRVLAGDRLVAEGRVVLELDTGIWIALTGGAAVVLDGTVRRPRVNLEGGSLGADLRRREQGHEVIFATPHVRVRVLGTCFTLTVDADTTLVELEIGHLEVERLVDGRRLELTTGQRVTVGDGVPFTAEAIPASAPIPAPAPP